LFLHFFRVSPLALRVLLTDVYFAFEYNRPRVLRDHATSRRARRVSRSSGAYVEPTR
jgi:hypothetical protein